MMKAEPVSVIKVRTPYLRTGFDQLRVLSIGYVWDKDFKCGVWFFHRADKEKVEAILGEPIEIEGEKKLRSEEVEADLEKKGEGSFEIFLNAPDFYRVVSTIGNKRVSCFDVPKANVLALWETLCGMVNVGEATTTPRLAEKLMERLGIDRFNREDSGTFDWAKFFGTRGHDRDKGYFVYLYYCLKVLHCLGALRHKGSEKVVRLMETCGDLEQYRLK